MPILALQRHPASPTGTLCAVTVGVTTLADGSLQLRYRVHGQMGDVFLPAPAPFGPADDLWQHTCLECFIGTAGQPGYHEFNFSPSGQWAAYAFSSYRQRLNADMVMGTPDLCIDRQDSMLTIYARIPAYMLPSGPWNVALSAVVEMRNGSHGYWALAHTAARPDFHQREAFVLQLAP